MGGLDLLHETPILDIKPLIPLEQIDPNEIKTPSWINGTHVKLDVIINTKAKEQLENILNLKNNPLTLYNKNEQQVIEKAIIECLQLDPRPQRKIDNYKNVLDFDN